MAPIDKKERVITYVDGFNLYFGMLEAKLDECKWLNLKKLIEKLLKQNQSLVEVKYFTSRVSNNPEKQKRQSTYIDTLETSGVKIYYGHFQSNSIECNRCGHIWPNYNEKMTDVNIATQLMVDAYQDNYDMGMLISVDSDLVPPIRAIQSNFKNKRIFVAFPPKRHNQSVAHVSKGSMIIGKKLLRTHQFEKSIDNGQGFILQKPTEWEVSFMK